MVDSLNDNSGAVQAIATCILVAITAVYAILTWLISKNAGKQAEASIKMAEEMREQRLALDRPNLRIYRYRTTPKSLPYLAGQSTEEELAQFPRAMSFTVCNDGPGLAKSLSVVCADFLPQQREFLLPNDTWDCILGGRGVAATIEALLGTERNSDGGVGSSIVVRWSDVHDRRWETRLELAEAREGTGSTEEPNEMCLYIESGEQHTFGPYSPEVQQ